MFKTYNSNPLHVYQIINGFYYQSYSIIIVAVGRLSTVKPSGNDLNHAQCWKTCQAKQKRRRRKRL